MIHTGDITHLSKPAEFDDAERIISQARLDVHYVPGEHDLIDRRTGQAVSRSLRPRHQGRRLVQLRRQRRALHRPGQRRQPQGRRPGQSRQRAARMAGRRRERQVGFARRSWCSRTSRFGPSIQTGAGAREDGAQALGYLKKFGSVTVLNGHIHQVMQKVEGNVTFHTARSTAFPQPAPGTAPSPGPMKVRTTSCARCLASPASTFKQNEQRLAIIDMPLQG